MPPEPTEIDDLSPLIMPVDAEFRVGTMGLGWDSEAQSVVVELLAVTDAEFDASVVLDDTEEGPDAVRVFLTPESARQFATRSYRVISAGRPPCPLCDEPLDPEDTSVRAPTVTGAMCCSGLAMTLRDDEHAVLADGELTVLGRIRSASNATFCVSPRWVCAACIASTSRSRASGRCGISPTERWPAANSAPIWCRHSWAGTWCRTPSSETVRRA